MKKSILFFAIICSISKIDAQSISMESISSGGDHYTSTVSRLSGTVGELMSGTHANASNTLVEGFQQQYYTYWVGAVSNSWTDLLNWGGGPVPGAKTDIIILAGKPFYPVITLNVSCRSLIARPGTTVTVNPGFGITISN